MAGDDTMRTAMELRDTLASWGYPSFVKPMLQSHVSRGYWLGLPMGFCREHLPNHNETMRLMDEDGAETDALYLAGPRMGISAGWRSFALEHGLLAGDCLVFQLIQPTKLKVYIVRQP